MKQILAVFTFIFLTFLSNAQKGFDLVIDKPQDFVQAIFHSAIEGKESSSYVLITSLNRDAYGQTCFKAHIDANGKIISYTNYLDSINPVFPLYSIKNANDTYLCGRKFSHRDTGFLGLITKLDENLDTIWFKEIKGIQDRNILSIWHIIKTKSGNLAMVGDNTDARPFVDVNKNNVLFILTDSIGNILNSHLLPKTDTINPLYEQFYSIVEDDYGDFYASGLIHDNNNRALVAKYNSKGEFLWRKEYSDSTISMGFLESVLMKDGSLLFIGTLYDRRHAGKIAWQQLINIDTSGNEISRKKLFSNYFFETPRCVEDAKKNLICVGSVYSSLNARSNGYLIKFSPQGEEIWQREFDRTDLTEQFWGISKSSEGGYYLTGTNWIKGNNSSKAWIVKVDSNGCVVPRCTTDFITEKEPHKDLFLLSPNPAQDYMNVYMNDAEFYDRKYDLDLYDQQGRIVQHHVIQGRVTQLDLNSLSAGMYYYRIVDGRNKFMQSGRVVVNG